jgi:hypothetical protein
MSLQDDALQLAELDRRIIRDLLEKNTDDFGHAVGAYLELRGDLRKRLLHHPTTAIEDTTAADVLRKVAGGDGLPSDEVIERLVRHSDKDYNIDKFTEGELDELGHELFDPWFSHYEYVEGLAELRPLVLRHPVPEFVSRLVAEIKGCYAFQQYDAAYSMCRTLIEACIRDICVRRNLFPDLDKNIILFGKYHWGTLRDNVASGTTRGKLNDLYSELSTLVHGRKSVTKQQARGAFKGTLEVVEKLYALHGL